MLGDQWFDDTAPYGADPAIYLTDPAFPLAPGHPNALKAAVGDVNLDGDLDVVLAGNSSPAVAVYYLTSVSPPVTILAVEHLAWHTATGPNAGTGTYSAYDLELVDVNNDGEEDIVVGRLLGSCDVNPSLSGCTIGGPGRVDTVFLNDPTAGFGTTQFPASLAVAIPNPLASTGLGATFGLVFGFVDDDPFDAVPDTLDMVRCGSNYPVLYYSGNGTGAFTYQTSYTDNTGVGYRDVQLGDLDGDGDEDLVVSRVNGGSNPALYSPNRVWFNQRAGNPSFNPANPFTMSIQPAIGLPSLDAISWTGSGSCTSGSTYMAGSSFESALGDLDTDGDLDLVCASSTGNAAAYRNNGFGFFGCFNAPTTAFPRNNGRAAYVFPPITSDWTGQSVCVHAYVDAIYGASTPLNAACNYTFTVPGSWINWNTGVDITDVDLDGLQDVAVSNRNDMEEICVHFGGMDYFAPGSAPDDTYDFVFYNQSTTSALDFNQCVEFLGLPDDGTGYGELVRVNHDHWPDWVDANYANNVPSAGVTYPNHVFFNQLQPPDPPLVCVPASSPSSDSLGHVMHYSFGAEFAGMSVQVLASGTGTGGFDHLGASVPLGFDEITARSLSAWSATALGWIGQLDEDGRTVMTLQIPEGEAADGDGVYVVALVIEGGRARAISHVSFLPLVVEP